MREMFNYVAEGVALYLSLLVGISTAASIVRWSKENIMFINCAFCISLSSLLNIISCICIERYGDIPLWLNYGVSMLYFISLLLTMIMFVRYFINFMSKGKNSVGIANAAIFLPYIAFCGIVLSSPVTGWIFTFGASGYVRGPLSVLTYILMIYYAVVIITTMFKNRQNITVRVRSIIMLFPFLSGGVMLVQFVNKNVLLTGTAALGPLLLMFMFLEKDIVDMDTLTGFSGHQSFLDVADKRFQKKDPFSAVLISIDNFQELADTLGRKTVNKLVSITAGYIEEALERVTCFRYSENEFTVIFDDKTTYEIDSYLAELVNRFKDKWVVDDNEVFCRLSVGAVYCPQQAQDTEQLLELLEYAVSVARDSRDFRIFYCDSETYGRITRRKEITRILKRELAAEENNFELYFQPIYETETGKFHTAESLIRLNKTEIGPIYPDEFIPIAEEMGMIVRLGEIVMDKACEYIAKLEKEKVEFDGISVNFSVHQMLRDTIIDEVVAKVTKWNIPAEKLRIEITESVIIDKYDQIKRIMETLGVIGIKFYMDDFGTGYSNLSNMLELPFEYLKIDKSLVRAAEKSDKAYMVLSLISEAFVEQGVKILTEGVETEEQEEIVRSIGATYIQGYLFARPVPGDVAKEYFLGHRNDKLDKK